MCLDTIKKLLTKGGRERPSPGNWIPWSAIKFENGKITINLPEGVVYKLSGVGDSGSMDPVLDDGTMTLMYQIRDGTPFKYHPLRKTDPQLPTLSSNP